MKHLIKFNEKSESNELGFKLVGSLQVHELKDDIKIGRVMFKLPDGREVKEGYTQSGYEFLLIMKDGEIEVAISEYELMNPFLFGDVIIVPGHDSITCYNVKTGESKVGHIR